MAAKKDLGLVEWKPPTPRDVAESKMQSKTAEQYDMEREAVLLEEQRISSGGLSDDPTESGEPVRNKRSFKITKG